MPRDPDQPASEWAPAFPSQRPPFEAGHTVTLRHGAYSSRTVEPLAEEIEQAARTSSSWPPYLDDPSYLLAVRAWASAEAVAELLRRHLAGQDFTEALADVTEEESTETATKGRTTRRSTSRRVRSALELLDRAESRAANHRARLGLDPLSRARLGRDVTSARSDLVQILTAQREARERGDGQ